MSTAPVFDRLYDRYDSWYERHPALAESEARLAASLLGDPGYPCVEVGVGTGWFARRLGCHVGVDPSLGMLRRARERGVEAVAGVGEALPLADSSVKAVLLIVTLCFVDDPARVVAEASRVLLPGGILVSCIVPRSSPWGEYYRRLASQGHPFYAHARFLDPWEVHELAEAAGLSREAEGETLTYPPGGEERVQDPQPATGRGGFHCTRYRKP